MKQITQLRQHLKNIITITNTNPHVVSDKTIGSIARQALALLTAIAENERNKK